MTTNRNPTQDENEIYASLYEEELFIENVSEEFKCPICLCILKDPQQLTGCGHMYCKTCITSYYQSTSPVPNTCPIDRRPASLASVIPAPRAIVTVIGQLQVRCRFNGDGCRQIMTLNQLNKHDKSCRYGPCGGPKDPTDTSKSSKSPASGPDTFKVYVKLVAQSKTTLIDGISENSNIMALKQRLHDMEGLDIESMSLQFGSKPLHENSKSLKFYNVTDGSVIFCTRRFLGGFD